jgi:hypothetical protein
MKLNHFRNKTNGNEVYTNLHVDLRRIGELPDEAKAFLGDGDIVFFETDVQPGEAWIAGPDTKLLFEDLERTGYHLHQIKPPRVEVTITK